MFWMYILHNPETDRFYIGSTSDIERRLTQHTKGYTRTTRVLKTFKLIYKEEFRTLTEARLREKQLKSYKAKNILSG